MTSILTQGGADDLPLLEFLGDEDAYLLHEKAEQLLQFDGDKRAALVVREMRRQMQFAGLPDPVRHKVPTKDGLKATRLEMMRIVRQLFEHRFVPMPVPPGEPTNFYFKDIVLLDARELVQLIRDLGMEQLATAFYAVGKRKLAELCHSLGRQAADELIAEVREIDPRVRVELRVVIDAVHAVHRREVRADAVSTTLRQRREAQACSGSDDCLQTGCGNEA